MHIRICVQCRDTLWGTGNRFVINIYLYQDILAVALLYSCICVDHWGPATGDNSEARIGAVRLA